MISPEGESVALTKGLKARGNVEVSNPAPLPCSTKEKRFNFVIFPPLSYLSFSSSFLLLLFYIFCFVVSARKVWLCAVEEAMVKSLRALTKASLADYQVHIIERRRRKKDEDTKVFSIERYVVTLSFSLFDFLHL